MDTAAETVQVQPPDRSTYSLHLVPAFSARIIVRVSDFWHDVQARVGS